MRVEWSKEGPKVIGEHVVLSATETAALVKRYHEHMVKALVEGRSFERAQLPAILAAFEGMYLRAPSDAEVKLGATELGRKLSLFLEAVSAEAIVQGLGRPKD